MGGKTLAAKKRKPARGKGKNKALRGRMPTKRSINLILVDENKISLPKAVLGVLLIVALAAAFSKYMVADRLIAMSEAAARVSTAKSELTRAEATLKTFGDVEDDYAHYTYSDMTAQELNLVDRISVLKLVRTMLPGGETTLSPEEFVARVKALSRERSQPPEDGELPMDSAEFWRRFWLLVKRIVPTGYQVRSWSASGNLLNLEMSATSLERLNKLARELERESIVDTCAITTANKRSRNENSNVVQAQLQVYLQQPREEAEAE